MKCIMLLFVIYCIGCSQQSTISNELLKKLKINHDDIIIKNENIISEKTIPYDTVQKKISLFELNDYQKKLITNKISPFNRNTNYKAYLYEVQLRAPSVSTLIIYTDSDFGNLLYLINFKDTVLKDYIYNDGDYGDVIEQKENIEIVEGYEQWFEFHNDTVYKVKNTIRRESNYSNEKRDIEYKVDSVISVYKIQENGMFYKFWNDSISFRQ